MNESVAQRWRQRPNITLNDHIYQHLPVAELRCMRSESGGCKGADHWYPYCYSLPFFGGFFIVGSHHPLRLFLFFSSLTRFWRERCVLFLFRLFLFFLWPARINKNGGGLLFGGSSRLPSKSKEGRGPPQAEPCLFRLFITLIVNARRPFQIW